MTFKVKIIYNNGEECLKYMTKREAEAFLQLNLFEDNILEVKYSKLKTKKE